jgi:hypothetical protein
MSSGGSTPATTQQVSKVELPEWVNTASQQNYDLAKQIAGRPLEQYTGQQVASPGAMTTQGYDAIQKSLGSTDPLYAKATGMLDKSSGYQDAASGLYNKAAGTLDQTAPLFNKATGAYDAATGVQNEAANIYRGTAGDLDINKYLNPYTQEVEQRAIGNAETALDKQLTAQRLGANAAAGFGGSRGEVGNAVLGAEGTRGIGDLSAQLRRAGIDFATQTAISDRAGKQAAGAGLLGVGSGLQGSGAGYLGTAAGLQNTAAGYGSAGAGMLGASAAAGNTAAGYGNTAAGMKAAQGQDISSLLQGGQAQQTQQQNELNAIMKQFYEKRDYPVEGLNMRLAALGMSPYGKTETTNKTATSEDKGPDWASIGLGTLKTLPALLAMSDRNTKTDIKKLTDGPVPLYAYRYKGDPKSYPKVVGPMAQDIEKVRPSAIKKVGKYKTVDLNNLMEVLK